MLWSELGKFIIAHLFVSNISFLLRNPVIIRVSKDMPARWYNLSTSPVELIEHHELLEENT